MNTDEDCSWQDVYIAMGCDLPYEDDGEPDEIDDDNELTRAVDEIRIPLSTPLPNPMPKPRPAPGIPYRPDIRIQSSFDLHEPSFTLFSR